MELSFLDKDLVQFFAQEVEAGTVVLDFKDELYWRMLAAGFPAATCRIDWSKVPGAISWHPDGSQNKREDAARAAIAMWRRVQDRFFIRDEEQLIVIGDGVDIAVLLHSRLLVASIPYFLTLPQHTYAIPEDVSWCFNLTFENSVHFGFAPLGRDTNSARRR